MITTERFKKGLEVLAEPPASANGRWVVVPPPDDLRDTSSADRVRKQRAVLFHVLVAAVPVTLTAALLLRGGWWEVHIATDFTLAIYVAGLLETQRRRVERRAKVRSLSARRGARGVSPAERAPVYEGRR